MSEEIDARAAFELLSHGHAVLVDVRTPEEFQAEHILYAMSLPLSRLDAGLSALRFPEQQAVIFHCQKGGRGGQACAIADEMNHAFRVYNLTGGMNAWKEKDLPVVDGAAKFSIFRQVQMIVGGLILGLIILGFTGLMFAFALAGVFAAALMIAGLTGWCGLAKILQRMPWNRKSQ
ncbi:MAG: rhodanese-like domain-containing protein [Pseudomonadota bacterium]